MSDRMDDLLALEHEINTTFYQEEEVCDGCGEINGHCPLCCGNIFACGSEECDFCEYSDECG